MRTLIFLTSFLIVFSVNAQLTLSAKGGWNSTAVHIVKTQQMYKYEARPGWQAGLQAAYTFKTWLLYAGLQVDKRYFNYLEDYNSSYGKYYKPTFLTLPVGIGYNHAFAKNLGFRLYSGLYVSKGIGGKYYSKLRQSLTYPPYICDPGACPEIVNIEDRKIRFGNQAGNSTPGDLRAANWGTQFGVGLLAWQQFELVCMYNLGLSNILPAGTTGEDHRLRSVSLDVKVNLTTFANRLKK